MRGPGSTWFSRWEFGFHCFVGRRRFNNGLEGGRRKWKCVYQSPESGMRVYQRTSSTLRNSRRRLAWVGVRKVEMAAICRGSVVMKRKVGWCLSESQARLSPPHSSSVTSSCLLLFSHFLPSHPSPFLPTVPSLFFLFMWHIWIFSVWRISLRTTWHLVFSHDCRCERQGWGDTPALGLSWSGFLVLW